MAEAVQQVAFAVRGVAKPTLTADQLDMRKALEALQTGNLQRALTAEEEAEQVKGQSKGWCGNYSVPLLGDARSHARSLCRPEAERYCGGRALAQEGDGPLEHRGKPCSADGFGEEAWLVYQPDLLFLSLSLSLKLMAETMANMARLSSS